jgi:Ser/Thr protein kinase RdoA (MazF antagonist)
MPCTAKALVNAGQYLGKMDRVLDAFDHPGAHRVHQWDLQVRGPPPSTNHSRLWRFKYTRDGENA